MRPLILAAVLALPLTPVHAAGGGGGSTTPPKQTQTTQDCFKVRQWDPDQGKYVRFSQKVNGVWDAAIGKCVRPDRSGYLGDDALYGAVRELAYAGRYDSATQVLDQMSDQAADEVLTYRGFIARKQGKLELADVFYTRAIEANPDNILARSYMGQGLVAAGDKVAALQQLREIQARGGAGTWAEASLRDAIATGTTYSY
ncbi:MAG: hypothetical protein AAFY38_02720 [Pseudomonadota bacterium]